MSWIVWAALGGLVGWNAGISTGNNTRTSIIWHIMVGIAGALAGSSMLGSLGDNQPPGFSIMAALVAVGSAAMLLFLFRLVIGQNRA